MKLLTRIAQHAVRKSEQIAYRTEGQMLTYGMLWDKSRRLASLLHAIKLERQTPIVVYGHMGIDMPVSFLACVQAGHPYIPVDT
ncbi:AMP-binding protein, partial [Bacillus paranthracis]